MTSGPSVDLSHGDHDVRLLDTTIEEACTVAGEYLRLSWRMKFDRGSVVYCPECGAVTLLPYRFEEGLAAVFLRSPEGAAGSAVEEFRASFPPSCASSKRLGDAREVLET